MSNNFKKQGIKGRPSKKDKEQRKALCRELYLNNPALSANEFEYEFKKVLKANHLEVPSSPRTFKNIYKDAHISFIKNKVELDDDILLTSLRDTIAEHISQIRVTCRIYEAKLFDEYDVSDTELNSDSSIDKVIFLSHLNTLQEKKNEKKISSSTLTTMYIILNTAGFEKYIEDILEKELKNKNECLYIETHRFCVKIILEYKDLAIVAEKMYKLINTLEFKFTNS